MLLSMCCFFVQNLMTLGEVVNIYNFNIRVWPSHILNHSLFFNLCFSLDFVFNDETWGSCRFQMAWHSVLLLLFDFMRESKKFIFFFDLSFMLILIPANLFVAVLDPIGGGSISFGSIEILVYMFDTWIDIQVHVLVASVWKQSYFFFILAENFFVSEKWKSF